MSEINKEPSFKKALQPVEKSRLSHAEKSGFLHFNEKSSDTRKSKREEIEK